MLRDVDFLAGKLGKIDGFNDTSEFLHGIIKSKQVKVEEAVTEKKSSETSKGEEKPEELATSEEATKNEDEK